MNLKCAFLISLCGVQLACGEAHREWFRLLDSSQFQQREQAQEHLNGWIEKNPEKATKFLLEQLQEAQSPEVRSRLALILRSSNWLKTSVIAEKYGAPKGFVGVTMIGRSREINGKIRGVIRVGSVHPGSPAEAHGIQGNDEIWRVDGKELRPEGQAQEDFHNIVTSKHAGEKVVIELFRKKKAMRITLFLAERGLDIQRMSSLPGESQLAREKEQYFESWLEEQIESTP